MLVRRWFIAAILVSAGASCAIACGFTITGDTSDDDNGNNGAGASSGSSGTSGAIISVDGAILNEDDDANEDAGTSNDATAPTDSSIDGPPAVMDATVDAPTPPVPTFGMTCPAGTVYEDDFSTNPFATPNPRWIAVAGTWTWNAAQKSITVTNLNPHGVIWIGPRPAWRNYSIEVTETGTAPAVPTDHGDVGPIFRITSVGNGSPPPNNAGAMYLAAISFQSGFDMLFGRFEGGNWNPRATASPFNVNGQVTIRADAEGQNIRIFLGTSTSISMNDNTYANGSIGIRTYRAGVVIHRVKVTCRP